MDLRKPPSDIKELTSIRFFAAFTVVIFHMFYDERSPPSFWNNLISDGHLGVDLFFILSGFILTHVYITDWQEGKFSYKDFLWKRFSRIYPLHIFMILAFIIAYELAGIVGFGGEMEGKAWDDLPWHIVMLHAWGFTDRHAWNFPSWSVSAELFAYLLFPVVLTVILKMRPLASLLTAIVLFVLISEVALSRGYVLTKMMYNFGIARIIVEFYLGVACYQIFASVKFPKRTVMPLIFLTLTGIVILSWKQADERLIVLLLAALIFFVACMSRMERATIMRHKAVVFLGEVSYATYMVHILVLISIDAISSKLGLAVNLQHVIAIILIYSSSIFLHRAIEIPSRYFLRNFFTSEARAAPK